MQHRNMEEVFFFFLWILDGKFPPSCGPWTAVSQEAACCCTWLEWSLQAAPVIFFIQMGIISWLFYPPNCTSWLQKAYANLWTKSPIVSDLSPVPYFLIPTGWLPRWVSFLLSSCLRFWALLPGLSLPSSPTQGPFRLVHPFQYFLAYSTVSSVILYSFMSNSFSPNVEQFLTILHSM